LERGGDGFVETSASLRFTYNADQSNAELKMYDGTGTALVRAKLVGCSEGSGTAPLHAADLMLHTGGALAGTYFFVSDVVVTMTVTCDGKQQTIQVPATAGVAGTSNCPSPQIGNDPSKLAGSWSCNLVEDVRYTANWTLSAVE